VWARGYFCRSSVNVTDEVIKAYIERQEHSSDDVFRIEGESSPSGDTPIGDAPLGDSPSGESAPSGDASIGDAPLGVSPSPLACLSRTSSGFSRNFDFSRPFEATAL
jgi:hypothetical protein